MKSNKFDGKIYGDLISVIVPLYGSFDHNRIQMSIDSLILQQKVHLEIIIAEQANSPKFKRQKGVTYTFIKSEDNRFSIPGFVRNKAAELSSGKYIYNSDGDIIYANPYYFAEVLELIKTGTDVALYRPPMRRLPIEDFSEFKEMCEKLGLESALNWLDMSCEFTARMPSSKISMIPLRKKESGRLKTFLFSSSDWEKYKADLTLKGSEPAYSTLAVHAGGTFMEKTQFMTVGGFCKRFFGWGCHDADLQWKLKKKFNLFEIPNSPEYQVIHLDHERAHFNKEQWQANRETQKLRRTRGVDAAILEDLKNGN